MRNVYHHVYTERDWTGVTGKCEECDFTTNQLHGTHKFALAACLREHPQPPMVVFAQEVIREQVEP